MVQKGTELGPDPVGWLIGWYKQVSRMTSIFQTVANLELFWQIFFTMKLLLKKDFQLAPILRVNFSEFTRIPGSWGHIINFRGL